MMRSMKRAQSLLFTVAALGLIFLASSCGGGGGSSNPSDTSSYDVDTDDDGVVDALEVNGYGYDWLMDEFFEWTEADVLNNPAMPYFKSDPLQPSTDQDPYNDGEEASGLLMDVTVEHPGTLPMVPAYPDIVVKLERYEVTLNTEITSTTGTLLQQGESWNVETYDLHTHTEESSWEATSDFKLTFSDLFLGAEVGGSYTDGESISDTSQTGSIASQGGSIMSQQEWQTAVATNPTDAARMKLYLKVYNYGTAPASNIIPTLTLRIGKRNIATFEPGNSQINLLEPGGKYPEIGDVFWTIDSIDTGATVLPISLTLEELRALETGAPVDVVVTQTLADVLTMDNEGHWVSAGNWHEYMARVESVSAKLFFDIGDGNVIDYLVYAGDNPSAPEVTLRDALLWVAGGYEDQEEQRIEYIDRVHGGSASANLDGWKLVMDAETWTANELSSGDNILDIVLNTESTILFKAPINDMPKAHYAFLDEKTAEIRMFASDYQGIASVEFIEDINAVDLVVHNMLEGEGQGFYYYHAGSGYVVTGGETLRITDADTPANTLDVEIKVIPDPSGIAPTIEGVVYDQNTFDISACVEHNGGSPITEVSLDVIGDPALQQVPMTYMGGCEYRVHIPCGANTNYMLVLAENSMGFTDSSNVTDHIQIYNGAFGSGFDVAEGDILDLETGLYQYDSSNSGPPWDSVWSYDGAPDLKLHSVWVNTHPQTGELFRSESYQGNVGVKAIKLPIEMYSGSEDFGCITRDDLEYWYPLMEKYASLSIHETGTIVVLHTGEHFVKILFTDYMLPNPVDNERAFNRPYIVFNNP